MIHTVYGIAFIIVIVPLVTYTDAERFSGRMAGFIFKWRIP